MEGSPEKYEEFKNCKRAKTRRSAEFILEFEQKYNRIARKNIKLRGEKLEPLSNANICNLQKCRC